MAETKIEKAQVAKGNPVSCFVCKASRNPLKFRTTYPNYDFVRGKDGSFSVEETGSTDFLKLTRSYRSITGIYNQVRFSNGSAYIVAPGATPMFEDISGLPTSPGEFIEAKKSADSVIARVGNAIGVDLSGLTLKEVLDLVAAKKAGSEAAGQAKEGEKDNG